MAPQFEILFDRDTMIVPSLSPHHNRVMTERTAGPRDEAGRDAERKTDSQKLAMFRQEFEAIAADYCVDNTMRQGYLMTRARKI